ncbi:hypothetical protein Tco_0581684 [Tanacetum coccineum]
MSTPVCTSSTDSQMHNNIMAAGSKDRPPMLGPGRYLQWRSRFLLQEGNGSFGIQDLCLRQELLEYMGVHDNDASESSQPSWGSPAICQEDCVLTIAFWSLRFASRLRFGHCVLPSNCVLSIAFCLNTGVLVIAFLPIRLNCVWSLLLSQGVVIAHCILTQGCRCLIAF